jgi:hypothetical protein
VCITPLKLYEMCLNVMEMNGSFCTHYETFTLYGEHLHLILKLQIPSCPKYNTQNIRENHSPKVGGAYYKRVVYFYNFFQRQIIMGRSVNYRPCHRFRRFPPLSYM